MASKFHSAISKLPATDLQETKVFYTEKLAFRQVGETIPTI